MSRRRMPHAQTRSPPTASAAQSAMPGHVELAEDRLAEVPVERQVEDDVGQVEDRADEVAAGRTPAPRIERHRRREARPDQPADGEPDARERHPVQPEDARRRSRATEIARRRLRRRPDRDARRHDAVIDARSRPARPSALRSAQPARVTGGAEDHLEAALALVGRPAGDERRRGDAHEQDRLGEERQLEEPAGRQDVGVREDPLDHRRRSAGSSESVATNSSAENAMISPKSAERRAPHDRRGQPLAERPRERPARKIGSVGSRTRPPVGTSRSRRDERQRRRSPSSDDR